jgi:Mat/Ecp fimbriae major subunit
LNLWVAKQVGEWGGISIRVSTVFYRIQGTKIMRKFEMKRALIGAAIAALAMTASTAQAAQATGTARAKILRQITLTNTSDLQYATIISGATASTVAVTTAGARTCGGGLTCTGTATSANFNVAGTDGAVVTVSGDSTVSLTGSLGGTMASTLTYSATTITLGASGGSFQVGGTLSVGANQASGDYSGTFNVTANYP